MNDKSQETMDTDDKTERTEYPGYNQAATLNNAASQNARPPHPGTLTVAHSEDPAVQAPLNLSKNMVKEPQHPTMGSNDPMNQQAQQASPSTDAVEGQWKQKMGSAKIAWGKLTDDELLKVEGHAEKLAGLIQERYAINREEAERQVKTFFEKN